MFGLDGSLVFLIVLAGLFIGFGKTTGLSVIGMFTLIILSLVFPTKEAIGILLPILLMGDLIAVTAYKRTVVWKHLFTLVPWILIGLGMGYVVLLYIENEQLKLMLGYIIISLIVFQSLRDAMGSKVDQALPSSIWFVGTMGTLAGFTTMIGNVAGPVMAVYLLAKRLPKHEFVGTGAWFYFFVNILKVPLYIQLDMLTSTTLMMDMIAIPAVLVGTWIGIKVLPRIPQTLFKWMILGLSLVGAIRLILEV